MGGGGGTEVGIIMTLRLGGGLRRKLHLSRRLPRTQRGVNSLSRVPRFEEAEPGMG